MINPPARHHSPLLANSTRLPTAISLHRPKHRCPSPKLPYPTRPNSPPSIHHRSYPAPSAHSRPPVPPASTLPLNALSSLPLIHLLTRAPRWGGRGVGGCGGGRTPPSLRPLPPRSYRLPPPGLGAPQRHTTPRPSPSTPLSSHPSSPPCPLPPFLPHLITHPTPPTPRLHLITLHPPLFPKITSSAPSSLRDASPTRRPYPFHRIRVRLRPGSPELLNIILNAADA